MNCRSCDKEIINKDKRRVYCSPKCRTAGNSKSTFKDSGMTPGDVGAHNEIIAVADLMARGYQVFRAESPACPFDLVTWDGSKLLRIEVKTAYKLENGTLAHGTPKAGAYDVLALVTDGKNVVYKPDMPIRGGKCEKNNEKLSAVPSGVSS